MATVTSNASCNPSTISVSGKKTSTGTISWSNPTVPSGATITSCVLTGKTSSFTTGNKGATCTINGTSVGSNSNFSINLGTANTTSSVSVSFVGGHNSTNTSVSFSNLIYTVTYEEASAPEPTYTVTFKDWDGVILKTESVAEGSSATAPTNPTREGYTFTGWDKSFNNVTSNLTITAQYEKNSSGGNEPSSGKLKCVARYIFNTATDTLPTFNSGYSYTCEDEISGSSTIRKIIASTPPTSISFQGCTGLTQVNFIDFTNITSASAMFKGCTSLAIVNLSYVVSCDKLTSMYEMFYGCTNLTNLKIDGLNTSKVTTFYNMLYNDSRLTSMGIGANFVVNSTSSYSAMFSGASALHTILSLCVDGATINRIANYLPTRSSNSQGRIIGVDPDPNGDYPSTADRLSYRYWNFTADSSQKRTLTFKDEDGTVFDTFDVLYGTSIYYPMIPDNKGNREFIGWTNEDQMGYVSSNAVFVAKYTGNAFPSFIDAYWSCGSDSDFMMDPIDDFNANFEVITTGYSYQISISQFKGKTIRLAVDDIKLLSIGIYRGGSTLRGSIIDGNNFETYYTIPNDDSDYYLIIKPLTMANTVFSITNAQLYVMDEESQIEAYTVEFGPYNYTAGDTNRALKVEGVLKGEDATPPTYIPEREGYTFIGWDGEYTNVTSDRVLKAQYVLNAPNDFLVAQYTTNVAGIVPTFNSGYEYRVEETVDNGIYTVKVYATDDFTSCSFANQGSLLTVDYLKVTNKVTSMANLFSVCGNLTYVNTANWDTSNVTNMSYMFWACLALPSIDVSSFNTSKVNYMTAMFGTTNTNGMALRTITGLEKLDTSNVQSMKVMFQLCKNLTSLETGIANWNVEKVTDMTAMFRGCESITSLDLSNWRVPLVTNIQQLFYGLTQMTTLNISNWVINQVTNYDYLFTDCSALHTVIMHNSNAVSVNYVIYELLYRVTTTQGILEIDGVDNIDNVDIMTASNKNWATRYNGEIINVYPIAMYTYDNYNIPDGILLPTFNEGFEYEIVADTADAFDRTWSNGSIDISNGQDISVADGGYVRSSFIKVYPAMQYYFLATEGAYIFYYDVNKNLIKSETLPLDMVSEYGYGYIQGVFPDNCEYIRAIKKTGENDFAYCIHENLMILSITSTSLPTKISFENCDALDTVYYLNMSEVNTMENMFRGCTNLKGIKDYPEIYEVNEIGGYPSRDWDTSNVTNMARAFYGCTSLSVLDINISDWNTSKVTTTEYMFYNCDGLTSLDLSNWNTDSLINCADMFHECINLESINLENWTTPNLQRCHGMFIACRSLTDLNISNLNTSNVTLMGGMFKNCTALTSLDVSHFNTSKATAMHTVFQGCDSLTQLDLSTWNTSNVNDFNYMLSCANLTTLKLNNWSIQNTAVTANMFNVSTNLKSIEMKNTNSISINKVIEQLLTRPANNPGSLNIVGVDDAAQVNVASAQSKYWNIEGAYCTVVFKDWDGSTLKTESVIIGTSATAPNVPNREGYNFTGWDKDFSNVTSDLVVTAQYTLKPSYTVTFVDWDGTILKTQTVMEGSNAIAPNNPYREGYIFIGWNASFDNVLSNLIIEAQYIVKSKIKVTFLNWNGSILKEEQVYEGESVTPPEAPTRIGYDFIGWDKSSNIIVEDTIINAVFTIKTFFVQFRDYNGVVLDEQRIDYNNSAVLPIEPIREGYIFIGWDKSLNNITSDTIIVAQYSKEVEALHTVVFKDWDGSILSTQEIEHGGSANGIPNPTRDNYVFSGWDNKLINITSDMIITAQYLYLGDFSDALSGVNFNNMSINKLSINGKDVNALYVGDMIILILKSQFFK